jgi:tryptophanyl-tRNA synthetase
VSNLLTILSGLTGSDLAALESKFAGAGYGDLKKEVAAAYLEVAEPFRDAVQTLLAAPDRLDDILADGARRAREQADTVLAKVYDRAGFLPARG